LNCTPTWLVICRVETRWSQAEKESNVVQVDSKFLPQSIQSKLTTVSHALDKFVTSGTTLVASLAVAEPALLYENLQNKRDVHGVTLIGERCGHRSKCSASVVCMSCKGADRWHAQLSKPTCPLTPSARATLLLMQA
jgi:hypothetical protein